MTGENGSWHEHPSVQPGGRPPAPGGLSLVQSFINSHFDLERDRGADLFATPGALRNWLLARGLVDPRAGIGRRERERALALRESLRELARCQGDLDAAAGALEKLNQAAGGAGVELRFAKAGPQFVLEEGGQIAAALGLVSALAARAMIEGNWSRLKVCPGDDCGWAFYDHSRNQTGRWCSMSVCGGRAKARAHYQRRRRGGD